MIAIVAFLTFILDQLTKQLSPKITGHSFAFCKLTPPHLNLEGAFSLPLPNALWAGATAFLITLIVIWVRRTQFHLRYPEKIALGFIIGGALGNFTDRLTQGGVIDFVSCSFWPAFNLADALIVVGVIILLLVEVFQHRHPKPKIKK